MILYEVSWKQVAELDRRAVVVVPFGAVEQHSLHLPMGTDSILVEAIAKRLDQRISERVCVLPVSWLGCSRHHMDFAGSLTAETNTFVESGEQLVRSMISHGFRNFILLNGHGGNINKISLMVEDLAFQGTDLRVVGVTYWHLINEEIVTIRQSAAGGMGHACELETSMMLAVRPDLVHADCMEADGALGNSLFDQKDMFSPAKVAVTKKFNEISRHGGVGDPTLASTETGERIFTAVLDKLVQVVEEIQSGLL